MRAVLVNEGNSLAIQVGVNDGHSAGEWNLADPFAEDFSLQLKSAPDGILFDTQPHLCVLHGIGKWRQFRSFRRIGCQFNQAVVLGERQRDVARIRQGQSRYILCGTKCGQKTDQEKDNRDNVSHREPPFLSRWKLNSAAGNWFSLVSSETRKIDGPKAGNGTFTGRMPVTFPPTDLARKFFKRVSVASFFSLASASCSFAYCSPLSRSDV